MNVFKIKNFFGPKIFKVKTVFGQEIELQRARISIHA